MQCPDQITYTIRQGDNLYQLSRRYKTTVQALLALNPNVDPYNLILGSAVLICPGEGFLAQPNPNPPACPNPAMQFSLLGGMRKAWEQHVYWTRMFLISAAARLPDLDATTARLMQNPRDIANIFAAYYSADTVKRIEQLLTEHLQIGGALIAALRDGQTAQADALTRRWYSNADEMADAFDAMSPFYQREEVRKMLYTHLDLTTKEVTERLAGNFAADIMAFDRVEQEALRMADYFSSGILRQFPQKFH